MASIWNKTLFYLGLVDEGEQAVDAGDSFTGDVRAVEAPPSEISQTIEGQGGSVTSSVRPPGAIAGRRVEPPASTRRPISSDPAHAEAGLYVHPGDIGAPTSEMPTRRMEPESQIIVARNFSDAQNLADAIRVGRSVVLDLRSTEPEMVRRIVDFASGLTYALDGKMSKTSQGVILVTPAGVSIGVNEQERLSRLGLFGDDQ
jgi:FtsZ-interacting cell division protein YlmF